MALILFLFSCSSKIPPHTITKEELKEKEAIEISYITNCLRKNKEIDKLIEWVNYGEKENLRCFKYKGILVFFIISDNTSNKVLKSIEYNRNSMRFDIFKNETKSEYAITKETRFNVWMSKDKLSIYFCMINTDNLFVWTLSKGKLVYFSSKSL